MVMVMVRVRVRVRVRGSLIKRLISDARPRSISVDHA